MLPPVLLLAYNRIDTLQQVWEALRQVRPTQLFISVDGPKPSVEDQARVSAVQRFVQSEIDWPCEAYFHFFPENQGCKRGVAGGISWFFSQVAEGIILEDDTLPHKTFFTYAAELLDRYRQDRQVGCISGAQLVAGWEGARAYEFIRFPLIWGWATWRRVWELYDVKMQEWPQWRDVLLKKHFSGAPRFMQLLQKAFDAVYEGRVDTWDYQLSFTFLRHGLLCAVPAQNLVLNLGHGHPLAVHTRKKSILGRLPLQAWQGGAGPEELIPSIAYEQKLIDQVLAPSLFRKALNRLWAYLTP